MVEPLAIGREVTTIPESRGKGDVLMISVMEEIQMVETPMSERWRSAKNSEEHVERLHDSCAARRSRSKTLAARSLCAAMAKA